METGIIEIPTTINVEVEKNSRGYNWKAVIVGAKTVEQAIQMLSDAEKQLSEKYGGTLTNN